VDLVGVLAIALLVAGTVTVLVAGAVHLRAVRRGVDGEADRRHGAMAGLDVRALPAMVVTAAAVVVVRNLRGSGQALLDTLFAAVFLGAGLSAVWYLLARRLPEPSHRVGVQIASVVAAAVFGICWALAGR
jgi:hypothetical protein